MEKKTNMWGVLVFVIRIGFDTRYTAIVWRTPFVHPAIGLYFLAFLLFRDQIKMEKWTTVPHMSPEQFCEQTPKRASKKTTKKQTNMRERILTDVGEEVWREAHLFPSPSKGRKEKRRAKLRKSEKKQDHQDE